MLIEQGIDILLEEFPYQIALTFPVESLTELIYNPLCL